VLNALDTKVIGNVAWTLELDAVPTPIAVEPLTNRPNPCVVAVCPPPTIVATMSICEVVDLGVIETLKSVTSVYVALVVVKVSLLVVLFT
jgi:hypothetical protein